MCVTGQHSWSQSQYMFTTNLGDFFRSKKLVEGEGDKGLKQGDNSGGKGGYT